MTFDKVLLLCFAANSMLLFGNFIPFVTHTHIHSHCFFHIPRTPYIGYLYDDEITFSREELHNAKPQPEAEDVPEDPQTFFNFTLMIVQDCKWDLPLFWWHPFPLLVW